MPSAAFMATLELAGDAEHSQPGAGSRRRERDFLARNCGQRPQTIAGERFGPVVGKKQPRSRIVQEIPHSAALYYASDQIALHRLSFQSPGGKRNRGALHQQIDPRASQLHVIGRERDLLADNRRKIRIERKQELLDVPASRVRVVLRETRVYRRMKHRCGQESEQRIGGAIAGESKPADLISGGTTVRLVEKRNPGRAEHADLGVLVPQVRDLDDLRERFEALVPVRTEKSL